ncbi:MAG: YqiA/YcfP family alpha/beta fold hydrolase [Burkholderiaceae bacterium]|nr:YqiA/YcfP family alpha/beta fold hydrolase [Burkholderiaceae bacterium]
MRTTHLLYLHGFRSSPQSTKARQMHQWVLQRYPQVHFACPQLPPSPLEAITLIETITANWPASHAAVMGSSLGGFYATYIAHQKGWPSVVINPAVAPYDHGDRLVGTFPLWHDPNATMTFTENDLQALKAYAVSAALVPINTMAIVAKGDEVLDWREMSQHYHRAQLHLIAGGDHGLSNFEPWQEPIAEFLHLAA